LSLLQMELQVDPKLSPSSHQFADKSVSASSNTSLCILLAFLGTPHPYFSF
jgi:hypothetical protein